MIEIDEEEATEIAKKVLEIGKRKAPPGLRLSEWDELDPQFRM